MAGLSNTVRRYHLHFPGFVYLGMTLLVGIAAMNTQLNLLFGVFGVMVAGFVLSLFIPALMLMAVKLRRLDPQHGAVGESLLIRYRVRNRFGFMPLFNLHIEEVPIDPQRQEQRIRALQAQNKSTSNAALSVPRRILRARPWQSAMKQAGAWIMHLSPRESTHTEALFWPTMRGRVAFDRIRVWSSFPFGIVRKSMTISQPHTTLIFPRLHRLRPDVLNTVTASGPMGMRMSERVGHGDNYYGVREYREGDSLRQISWKHTARFDDLISIERSQPSPPKLRIILNLTRPTEELRTRDASLLGKRAAEERAISLAASIVYEADAQGYEIGLSVLGTTLPDLPVRRNRWHLGKLMAALAAIQLDQARSTRSNYRSFHAERSGIIVIHPDRVDPTIVSEDAWHMTAQQLDDLSIGALGWDPEKIKHIPDLFETAMSADHARNGATPDTPRKAEAAA